MDTVKVNLRLRGIKGPGTELCFETPKGEHQSWIAGEYVMTAIDYNQLGKILEVELLSDVAAERGWL